MMRNLARGALLLFASPDSEPRVLMEELLTPASMARDPITGELFITESGQARSLDIIGFNQN